MFGILLSALNSVLGWIFRSLLVKFFIFFALYFITTGFVSFIVDMLPSGSSINSALSGIGASTWFFLDVFMIPTGLSAIVSAYAKVSCDLVLMVQHIRDLHLDVRNVIESHFRTTKLKTVGLNNSYLIEMWQGADQAKRSRVSAENKRYNKEIFPLYSSYSGGAGKEKAL